MKLLRISPLFGLFCAWPLLCPAQQPLATNSMPSSRTLNRYNLERLWWSQAVLDPARETIRYLTVDEETLYVQSTGGNVTAFDSESGQRRWSVHLGRRDDPSFPVVTNENLVLVSTAMTLHAVDKFDGKSKWKVRLPAHPSGGLALDDRRVYMGSADGSIYALDLKMINNLYDLGRLPEWSFQTLDWRYKTGKEVSTPPITTGRLVIFASRDGSLYSISADGRTPMFQLETGAPISAPMAFRIRQKEGAGDKKILLNFDRRIYMAARDFNFYCISADNGKEHWHFVSGLPIYTAPTVIRDDVFVLPARGGMHSLNAVNGKQQWWNPRITGFVAASNDTVYGSDKQGNLIIMDRKKGATIGAIPIRHFNYRIPNDRTDRIYVATQSGLIVCLREKDRKIATFHMHPERQPILPVFVPDDEDHLDDGQGNNLPGGQPPIPLPGDFQVP